MKVILECSHAVDYEPTPMPGSLLFCYRCNDYQVYPYTTMVVHIRCGNCRLSRNFGADMSGARRLGTSHVIRNPEHTVTVYQGKKVVTTMRSGDLPLPDYLQWISDNPDHQTKLRALPKRDLNRGDH